MNTEQLFNLPIKTADDISTQLLNRFEVLSKQYKIINIFDFDFNTLEVLSGTGIRLLYSEQKFNDMYITSDQLSTKKNNYMIYIKLNLCYKLTSRILTIDEYNKENNCQSKFNHGEVWDFYITSIDELKNIFSIINNDNRFIQYNEDNLLYNEDNLFY